MVHRSIARIRLERGAIVNRVLFVSEGFDCSFKNSLMASAKG